MSTYDEYEAAIHLMRTEGRFGAIQYAVRCTQVQTVRGQAFWQHVLDLLQSTDARQTREYLVGWLVRRVPLP